jgi:hypothetical protein
MKTNYFKLTLVCLIAVVFNTVNAQNTGSDQRAELAFGIKAGVNFSNLYDTRGEDFSDKSKIGFAGGIFLSIPIGTYLGFQPELLYSQKGYKGSGNLTLVEYEYTRNVDYLDVPLLLQLKPIPGLSILAGPHFSFLLHKGLSFDSGNLTVEQQTEIRNNNIRKNILGVTGGLDIDLNPVVISGRVGWDLQHNNGDGTSTDPRFKNVWLQATLGLKF